jgi:hypothetical protein
MRGLCSCLYVSVSLWLGAVPQVFLTAPSGTMQIPVSAVQLHPVRQDLHFTSETLILSATSMPLTCTNASGQSTVYHCGGEGLACLLYCYCMWMIYFYDIWGSRVVQRSKALHLSARGVTDPGSIPGCITTGCDLESHRAAHSWPSVVRVRGGFGLG